MRSSVLVLTLALSQTAAAEELLKVGAAGAAWVGKLDQTPNADGTFTGPAITLELSAAREVEVSVFPPADQIVLEPADASPQTHERTAFRVELPKGRTVLTAGWARTPTSQRLVVAVRVPDAKPAPLKPMGEPAPEQTLAEKCAEVWFPLLSFEAIRDGVDARFALLKAAPRSMFVYTTRDFTAEEAPADRHVTEATPPEELGAAPAVEPLTAKEPVLLLVDPISRGLFVLATDGALFTMPVNVNRLDSTRFAPARPDVFAFPAAPRNTWLPLEALAAASPAAQRKAVEQLTAKTETAKACEQTASERRDLATAAAIADSQREAAVARYQKDHEACGMAALEKARGALHAKLLAARAARFAAGYKPVKPALAERLKSAPTVVAAVEPAPVEPPAEAPRAPLAPKPAGAAPEPTLEIATPESHPRKPLAPGAAPPPPPPPAPTATASPAPATPPAATATTKPAPAPTAPAAPPSSGQPATVAVAPPAPTEESVPVAGAAKVLVTSVEAAYPYYGLANSGCQKGKSFVMAELLDPFDGHGATTRVVLRIEDPTIGPARSGGRLAFSGLRRGGKGKDGTPVYCGLGTATRLRR